nr:thioesterase family protein [Parvularcula maris]
MREEGGTYHQAIPPEWSQGRTAYGGLTASMCLAAAQNAFSGLPPLRSAQIGFVGPAAGKAVIACELLRQGKSTSFVAADLRAEAGLATRALLVFGAARESKIAHLDLSPPDLPPLDPSKLLPTGSSFPAFLSQFDIHIARGGVPFSGRGEHRSFWWVRHRDEEARAGILPLIALADIQPPAIAPVIEGPAPVSSVTWQVDLLSDDPQTEDGWYLVETSAEWAGGGWSSQKMTVWDRSLRPVASHRQSVVVFT